MEKILISACLLGIKVRYDGNGNYIENPLLKKWMDENRLVSVCPEVKGGASVPRPPSEIVGWGGGLAVLNNQANITNQDGTNVTEIYKKGAMAALQIAQQHNIKIAILKEGSPSCGSSLIYDGSFSKKKISQEGITTALLRKHGIIVFNENQLDSVERYLNQIK